MSVGAVLVAAGSGRRLGASGPKAFVPVAGVPLVVHAARALLAADADIAQLVVTVPDGYVEPTTTALLGAVSADLWVVEGGPSRQASVALGLAALDAAVDIVVVHDAARAFAPASLVARVVAAVRSGHGAVVPGLPVVDTIKQVGPPDPTGARPVRQTPCRADLVAVQTPQGFARALLDRAHAAAADRADDETTAASDDAGLVEALGEPVWVVPGDESAWKITTQADLDRAERSTLVRDQ
ncbi:MAG: 2-C-methyl-D-erythritol 4-phosphate cytidylyltransferase [Micrococcales bacterium]|nr:2-C-methyl-D-erythritol 4-phosphate cytidylyltransferase [Micrococcales bacterium]